jgi:hypothetical protein
LRCCALKYFEESQYPRWPQKLKMALHVNGQR